MNIKGWKKFQHFKDRRPPWIKLYRDLLDDPEWHELDAEAAKALVMLWLIASENDGALPDTKKLAFRLRTTEAKIKQILSSLSHWLEGDDIETISSRYQDDAPETETETEKDTAGAVTSIYAFEAGIIRLTKKDFEKWKGAFSNLDLAAELIGLQKWADELGPSKWFHAVAGALAKRNREALQAKAAATEQQKSDGLTEFERNNIKYYGTKNPNLWGVV